MSGKIITAPEDYIFESFPLKIFLAGTIDQGNSYDWQEDTAGKLANKGHTVFNPRRKKWNPDIEQVPENEEFREQVEWELDNIQRSDLIIFNFLPNSKSPVTMAELGFCLGCNNDEENECFRILVCCPRSFYRYGNVKIMCDRNNVPVFDTMDELLNDIV